ncbi:MAG: hypothetical protein LBI67_08375 [Treponema sp.]|jgi:hypothetical protein|nr:hypothetical protein [Treponema sp.]
MKLRTAMYFLVFLASFLFVGCATKPATYSLSANEQNFSSVAFHNTFQTGKPNVSFVSFDGQSLPKPEKGTHWDPINFPSNSQLRIIVHADYNPNSKTSLSGFGLLGAVVNTAQDVRAVSRNVDTDIIFICPPLRAGKNYLLSFVKEPGMPGRNILTLTDIESGNIVEQQEFETVFGGDETK